MLVMASPAFAAGGSVHRVTGDDGVERSVLYALLLVLPVFSPNALNIIGLVNYALTQASVTLIIVAFIGFIGAITGLLASYLWYER